MSFASPWWLLVLPVCLWLLPRGRRRASLGVPVIRLWTEERGRARFLFLIKTFEVLGCGLLVCALARPRGGESLSVNVQEGIAIEVLMDVSSSMDMAIASPDGSESRTRMEVAKEMLERFIAGDGEDLDGRENDLIGLITFARYADTRSPLTSGHRALVQIVRNLEVQERPNEDGTAYGDALALAGARLRKMEELKERGAFRDPAEIAGKVIILLTDGENNSGQHLPEEAGGLAKAWGIKVYTISLGDEPVGAGGRDTLSAAEQVLRHISEETGGLFRRAGDERSLQAVYREIDALERTKMTTHQLDHVREWFWLPLGLAASAMVLALTLEATWLRTAP